MLDVTQSVTIAQPVQVVYDLITDVEATPRWSSAIVQIVRDSSGPLVVGDTFTEEATLLGRVLRTVKSVTELEPGAVYAEEARGGVLPHAVRITLRTAGKGTLLTFRLTGNPGRAAKLYGPLLGRALRAQISADLTSMKRLLERGAP
jgi:uncharacterized membrane protein